MVFVFGLNGKDQKFVAKRQKVGLTNKEEGDRMSHIEYLKLTRNLSDIASDQEIFAHVIPSPSE